MQILLSCGSVDAKTLDGYVVRLKADFADAGKTPLPDVFKKINGGIRRFSLEIRSLRLKDDADEWVVHHGLVNTEDDEVSKAHGIKHVFDETELRFFSVRLLPKLVEQRYMNTDDVTALMPKDAAKTKEKVHLLLERMERFKWLSRGGDKGYWELGPRSYLELRAHMETILKNTLDDDVSDEQRDADFAEAKAALPQIIYY